MKYCSRCGSELKDDAVSCEKCGNIVAQFQDTSPHIVKVNSGLSVAALVLSIIGFLTGFLVIGILFDIVAIILAVLVFIKAKKKPIKTGLPIASVLIAGISLVLCFGLFGGEIFTKTPSKSEMMADAMELDFREIAIEKYENEALFTQTYNEKACALEGIVDDISDTFGVRLVWRTGNMYTFTEDEIERMGGDEFFAANYSLDIIFADEEEMLNLKKGSTITVVGIFDTERGEIRNAYLIG